MYKIKSERSNKGSTREFDIVVERTPSPKSRAHLVLLRTRYRKLDDDFFLNDGSKNYAQYKFNLEYARWYKKRYGTITCSYCGG